MENSIWLRHNDYPGYLFSPEGNVYSLKSNKILKNSINKDGYCVVGLYSNNMIYTSRVHRVVSQIYIENKKDKPHINHMDGNKTNNNIKNLEWCTPKENNIHAFRVLGKHCKYLIKKGEENNSAKLNNFQVKIIKRLLKFKVNQKYIGNIFNVHRKTIGRINKGHSWTHIDI